jgi:O-antigen/teichoic acid export membrane protein
MATTFFLFPHIDGQSNVEAIEETIDKHVSQPLAKRAARGGLWVFALRISNRGLGLIRTIILARLLAPKDFGLFGIAMLSIATLETFSQSGFQTALIQKKGNIESYLDTAWTVSALRGTVLFCLLFLSAPLVARFFDSPAATWVIRVIALFTLLSGVQNIGILWFQKELEFNKQFYYEFSATIVQLSVAITLAFILRNVWALVWGGLAASFVRVLMSYVLHPYRPRIKIEKDKFVELFHFGKWVLSSGILIFLVTQGDDIFVGKVLGVTALGLYQMAYTLSNLPATEITHVISQVTFPAYSKLQEDLPRMREAYLRVLQLVAFLSFPLTAGIFLFASDFIELFLGEKWIPMVPAVQVLVLAALVRSIAATTGPILYATGKPRIDTFWQVIRLSILLLLIYPLTMRWHILGASLAVLISITIPTMGFIIKTIKILKLDTKEFTKPLVLPIFMTFLVTPIIFFYMCHIMIDSTLSFLLLIMIFVCLYTIFTYVSDRIFDYGIWRLCKELLAML